MTYRHTQILIFAVLSGVLLLGCNREDQLDVPPDGTTYLRATANGYHNHIVTPDLTTPFSEILKRFELGWHFECTGKTYWIGYTDDMYSIASRGEAAIPLILDFVANTKSKRAKLAAVYSIHLIGINCIVAGRFTENFESKVARQALLSLLDDKDIAVNVVKLLTRDPWETDLSKLFNKLSGTDIKLNKTITNALFRYPNDCHDFGGTLAEEATSPSVVLVTSNGEISLGTLTEMTKKEENESRERTKQLSGGDNDLIIQWGKENRVWKFENEDWSEKTFANLYPNLKLKDVINYAFLNDKIPHLRYFHGLEDPFNVSIVGEDIRLLTPTVSRRIWLEWRASKSKKTQ